MLDFMNLKTNKLFNSMCQIIMYKFSNVVYMINFYWLLESSNLFFRKKKFLFINFNKISNKYMLRWMPFNKTNLMFY